MKLVLPMGFNVRTCMMLRWNAGMLVCGGRAVRKPMFWFSVNISVNTPPKKSCHVLSSSGTLTVALKHLSSVHFGTSSFFTMERETEIPMNGGIVCCCFYMRILLFYMFFLKITNVSNQLFCVFTKLGPPLRHVKAVAMI